MAFIRKQPSKTSNPSPVSGQLSAPAVLQRAEQLGVPTQPLDVLKLAQSFGINVICIPMQDDVSGSLSSMPDGWVMKVNALHHPNRQRFTIAHELGHFFRHRGNQTEFTDYHFFRNAESNPMEIEANAFAGELLMPEASFKEMARTFNGSIEALANYFGVSSLAVRVRAKTLGMKGHGL